MDDSYVSMARRIYDCATEARCPLAQVTGRRAEAWLGDIDSPVVLLGGNPNVAEGLPYQGPFEAYLSAITTRLPELWEPWWPAAQVLSYISEAALHPFRPDLNNICVFNPIHCVTPVSEDLGRYSAHPEELGLGCTVKPLKHLLQRRKRVLIAHGKGALVGLRVIGLISKVPNIREALEQPAFEEEGHLIIMTCHLMSKRTRALARRSMPHVTAKVREKAETIRSIVAQAKMSETALGRIVGPL